MNRPTFTPVLIWSAPVYKPLNATVRWTVACRRLDGGNSLICSIGANAANPTRIASFMHQNTIRLHNILKMLDFTRFSIGFACNLYRHMV